MKRPSLNRRQSIVFVLMVVAISAGSIVVVQATPSQTATDSAEELCPDDAPRSPDLDFRWTESYTSGLSSGSEQDWDGGEIVRVGADGECSLLVEDGHSVSLDAMTINGTRGVVTGTVDIGANGSVRFSATGASPTDRVNRTTTRNTTASSITETSDSSSSSETTAETFDGNGTDQTTPNITATTNELVISNPGPDYGTNITLKAGEQSQGVSLSTGRFFQFVFQHDNGTARLAVWNGENRWDGTWDLTADTVSADEDWELTLNGRAFLDEITIGLTETTEPETATEPPTAVEIPADETTTDDGLFDPGDGQDTEPDSGENTFGQIFLGLMTIGGGVLVIRYARPLTRFGEQIDAIGSTTRPSEVEAAEWNVKLTKATGAMIALIGLFWIVSALT